MANKNKLQVICLDLTKKLKIWVENLENRVKIQKKPGGMYRKPGYQNEETVYT